MELPEGVGTDGVVGLPQPEQIAGRGRTERLDDPLRDGSVVIHNFREAESPKGTMTARTSAAATTNTKAPKEPAMSA